MKAKINHPPAVAMIPRSRKLPADVFPQLSVCDCSLAMASNNCTRCGSVACSRSVHMYRTVTIIPTSVMHTVSTNSTTKWPSISVFFYHTWVIFS